MDKVEFMGHRVSPLVRGEWIEIPLPCLASFPDRSPLVRGEWIEIERRRDGEDGS